MLTDAAGKEMPDVPFKFIWMRGPSSKNSFGAGVGVCSDVFGFIFGFLDRASMKHIAFGFVWLALEI